MFGGNWKGHTYTRRDSLFRLYVSLQKNTSNIVQNYKEFVTLVRKNTTFEVKNFCKGNEQREMYRR